MTIMFYEILFIHLSFKLSIQKTRNTMKNKNFVFKLLIVIFVAGFVSCDGEPPVFDKGKLIGNYTGSCTVSLGSKSEVVSDFPAEFKQKDRNSLYLIIGDGATYESIGISALKIATEFKEYKGYGRFNLEGINDSFGVDRIPDFIKTNISLTWDMRTMSLKLNTASNNLPKYIIASKNLTFTYAGVIEITGKSVDEKFSSPVTYVFNLTKK